MDRALEIILAQGGLGYAVAVVAGFIAYFLYREARQADERAVAAAKTCEEVQRKLMATFDQQQRELYEKRIEEAKSILDALTRNAQGLAALTAAVEARTAAFNELAQGFRALQVNSEASNSHFRGQADRLEGKLSEAIRLLTEIAARRPA